jgi:hypothetical protein
MRKADPGALKLRGPLPFFGIMKRCGVCGGEVRHGAIYRARDGLERRVYQLPATECVDCGTLSPDADKIDAMPDTEVPSSVRIRCADMLRVAS